MYSAQGKCVQCFLKRSVPHIRGVARGGPGVPVTPPLGMPSFEQYNIQVAKTP